MEFQDQTNLASNHHNPTSTDDEKIRGKTLKRKWEENKSSSTGSPENQCKGENSNGSAQLFQQLAQLMSTNQICEPLVFHEAIADWPALDWRPQSLGKLLKNNELKFRIGLQSEADVQWESDCHHVAATVDDFLSWLSRDNHVSCDERGDHGNPLSTYDKDRHWLYSDYTHMKDMFPEELLKTGISWSRFGLAQTGLESTFWLGTEGAYTPCHYDTYGYNLVAQIHGRKRWRLYPPSDTAKLYPSRVPYEESSVYSRVHIPRPDHRRFPTFKDARCYDVTLGPGDVLYVPRHWWHHVTSLDTTISINCWVDTPLDDECRLRESITRLLMCGLMTSQDDVTEREWLNPTEESTSADVNISYVNAALDQLNDTDDASDRRHCDTTIATETTHRATDCHCRVCHICSRLRPTVAMTATHIPPVATDRSNAATRVFTSDAVALETAVTFRDVIACVTREDVVELIGEHLKNMRREKISKIEEKS